MGKSDRIKARQAGEQQIMTRNTTWLPRIVSNVYSELVLIIGIVQFVGLARILIPLARKHTLSANLLKSASETADTCE